MAQPPDRAVKISISQIGWNPDEDAAAYAILRRHGVDSLEVAPTRAFPGRLDQLSDEEVRRFKDSLGGLQPVAMQALLFGKPELLLFGSEAARKELMGYLKKVVDLAAALGVGPMVFGSPKNRSRGSVSMEEAMRIAVPFFHELGTYAASRSTVFGMEANPPAYACDFLTNITEVAGFVRSVDSPGCRVHWDTGAVVLNDEDALKLLPDLAPVLCHYHISQPFLESFGECFYPHKESAAILRDHGYTGVLSVEMKRQPDAMTALEEAVAFACRLP